MTTRIAIVDDEPRMGEILAMVLRRAGHEVEAFQDPVGACVAVADDPVDLVITDLKMPGLDGLGVLARVRAHDPNLPVILMTAHATVATAISAIREGAFDYLEKPVDNAHLVRLVERALEVTRLARDNRYLRAELGGPDEVVAESEGMKRVLRLARRVAASRSTVLVTGESGTGKEVVARRIHYWSDRVGRPFVALNVKAVPESLFESELFGHARGAFTGAVASRPGLFERANGGTLFLDEIAELAEPQQAKLLRVLQEREVTRVGEDRVRSVDVRLVAATHRNLESEVGAGRFREDLYFRLSVIPVALPPLRERRDDILPLARFFLLRFATEACRSLVGFSARAESWLLGRDWPGNVRELSNAVERGVVMAEGDTVGLDDMRVDDARRPTRIRDDERLEAVIERATAEHVAAVLRATGGVKAEAARRLGVDRSTLYRLMARHGLPT